MTMEFTEEQRSVGLYGPCHSLFAWVSQEHGDRRDIAEFWRPIGTIIAQRAPLRATSAEARRSSMCTGPLRKGDIAHGAAGRPSLIEYGRFKALGTAAWSGQNKCLEPSYGVPSSHWMDGWEKANANGDWRCLESAKRPGLAN
jgi:hypothetical protein